MFKLFKEIAKETMSEMKKGWEEAGKPAAPSTPMYSFKVDNKEIKITDIKDAPKEKQKEVIEEVAKQFVAQTKEKKKVFKEKAKETVKQAKEEPKVFILNASKIAARTTGKTAKKVVQTMGNLWHKGRAFMSKAFKKVPSIKISPNVLHILKTYGLTLAVHTLFFVAFMLLGWHFAAFIAVIIAIVDTIKVGTQLVKLV